MKRNPDELSIDPIKRDFRKTTAKSLVSDIGAGFSVALLSIPQAIAYSIVAGVPPIAGLLSTIFGTMIASLLGSSRHLIIGPNNATVVLVQTAAYEIFATTYAPTMSPDVRESMTLELMVVLTLLIGFVQIIASVFKLGKILQFVSYAVIAGYVAGSALAITIDQLFIATGINCPDTVETLFQKMVFLSTHPYDAHMWTLVVAGVSLALIAFFKNNKKCSFLPSSLLMLIVVGGVMAAFNLSGVEDAVGRKVAMTEAGSLSQGQVGVVVHPLKRLEIDFTLLNSLIPVAFAIAFIGMLETNSVAKSMAVRSGQRVATSQDILALGCSNFFISFLSALPCSGSMSRTAVNYDSGAKTRFAGIFSGIFVAAIVVLFGVYISYLPQASLAAILLVTAPRMIDKNQIALCLRATSSDALVLLTTFLACIFFSLHIAFYMGVTLSIALYLRKAAVPKVVEYQYSEETGEMRPMSEEERLKPHEIRIINVEGDLFFGAVDVFQYALRTVSEDDQATKVIILRLKHVRDLDASAALGLKQLKEYLTRKRRALVISSVPLHMMEFLEETQLVELIGRDNIIVLDEHHHLPAMERAFARGQKLLGSSVKDGTGSNFLIEKPT